MILPPVASSEASTSSLILAPASDGRAWNEIGSSGRYNRGNGTPMPTNIENKSRLAGCGESEASYRAMPYSIHSLLAIPESKTSGSSEEIRGLCPDHD